MLVKEKPALSLSDKLNFLGERATHDLSCACGDSTHRIRSDCSRWIFTLHGKKVSVSHKEHYNQLVFEL